MTREQIRIGPEVRFAGPGGLVFSAHEVAMEIFYFGETPNELRLHLSLDYETWLVADAGAWFHLTPEVRGPTFAGGFSSDSAVELEIRLAPEDLTTLALLTEDYWDIGGLIRGDHLGSSYKNERAWFALNVKQALGGIKVGFATTWADA